MESVKSFIGGVAATVLGGLLLLLLWQKSGMGSSESLPPTPSPSIDSTNNTPLTFLAPTIRFYESGDTTVPKVERMYVDSFLQTKTRYVNWELSVSHVPPPAYKKFYVVALFYRSDGIEFARETLETHVEKGWSDSFHTWGWGWSAAGNWPKDKYEVVLSVNDKPVVKGNFVVY